MPPKRVKKKKKKAECFNLNFIYLFIKSVNFKPIHFTELESERIGYKYIITPTHIFLHYLYIFFVLGFLIRFSSSVLSNFLFLVFQLGFGAATGVVPQILNLSLVLFNCRDKHPLNHLFSDFK